MSARSKFRPGNPAPELIADLVLANRILYRQGVVDGFGHVSVRHDSRPDRFFLARSMAPVLVTADDILEFDLDSNSVEPTAPASYVERYIHSEIYRRRPDVSAVVHSHSPAVVTFSVVRGVPLQAVCHMAGFLGMTTPIFEIRNMAGPGSDLLIRDRRLGDALAQSLGSGPAVLMRGHGSTVVGGSLRQAVFRAVYTEVNAKLQERAMALGPVTFLTPEEAVATSTTIEAHNGRSWDLWWRMIEDGTL